MAQTRPPAAGARTRRSPIETLLEEHPGDRPLRSRDLADLPAAAAAAAAAGRQVTRAPGSTQPTAMPSAARGASSAATRAPAPDLPLPAVQDVALGLLVLLAEQAQRAGAVALGAGRRALVGWVGFVRSVSPQVATSRVDAGIYALAERGRRVRQESADTIATSVNSAFLSTVTSDAARELTVVAVERATDDVIAVVMPAMLEALRDEEIEGALDEMMAGLLVRQLPGAMEKTLPTLLMRTATRPTQLVPFLGGVLPR